MFSSRFIRPAASTFARATPRPIITNTPSIASRFFTTSSPKMTVHNIATVAEFKEAIAKHPIVVLDAFATWCGPCKAIAPTVAKWSEEPQFKDTVYFAKFDVDALPDLAQELGIRAMPTFVIFKNGDKADEFVGANPPALLATITKQL
ncbi:thioredoxin-domain-containing protein [Neurospora crassa]|uniref:Thioredoxin II n=2 Tax=Neurospora crassa TaxID=5141 RepID=F5HBN4_NEUCR|nr:thioredoxin II [Neurospora crassa OR74A]EAA33027.3 thioredoxin II [Neurospora crassa OR74A]KHE80528.1 thioredoxin-domain-containing protein [Neurospora crassa]|eukprot:XP_962263.3 thioredoxin II [Neurospora crassa OR74A]